MTYLQSLVVLGQVGKGVRPRTIRVHLDASMLVYVNPQISVWINNILMSVHFQKFITVPNLQFYLKVSSSQFRLQRKNV